MLTKIKCRISSFRENDDLVIAWTCGLATGAVLMYSGYRHHLKGKMVISDLNAVYVPWSSFRTMQETGQSLYIEGEDGIDSILSLVPKKEI